MHVHLLHPLSKGNSAPHDTMHALDSVISAPAAAPATAATASCACCSTRCSNRGITGACAFCNCSSTTHGLLQRVSIGAAKGVRSMSRRDCLNLVCMRHKSTMQGTARAASAVCHRAVASAAGGITSALSRLPLLLLRCSCLGPASSIPTHLRCLLVWHVQRAQLLRSHTQQMMHAAKLVRIIINICSRHTVDGKHHQAHTQHSFTQSNVQDDHARLYATINA